ncbi:hypothetical protein RFI_23025 [Reticulomyxa filosa]|uniref:Uncharacterized protein n=1 Tax=Reticulomyxa filosa TaxID=46433 RepID=X6ML39_RETFI|nr:hypothetical protein RFI_23025 [Reticulomyxa filosa]|eukprot:ETO14341.1 hypothetical protein RFI_23025 [Reticulomyxa filosa]
MDGYGHNYSPNSYRRGNNNNNNNNNEFEPEWIANDADIDEESGAFFKKGLNEIDPQQLQVPHTFSPAPYRSLHRYNSPYSVGDHTSRIHSPMINDDQKVLEKKEGKRKRKSKKHLFGLLENIYIYVYVYVCMLCKGFMVCWGLWNEHKSKGSVLLVLSVFITVLSVIVINMRRGHSAMLRMDEIVRMVNDFRVVWFILCVVIEFVVDIVFLANNNKPFWITHALVWVVSGLCFVTLDFATLVAYVFAHCGKMYLYIYVRIHIYAYACFILYLSMLGRFAYPLVFLVIVTIEMVDNVKRHHSDEDIGLHIADRSFTLYDLKIDCLLLVTCVIMSLFFFVVMDPNKSYFFFGLQPVSRRPYFTRYQLSQEPWFTLRSEDSALLLWLINLSRV